MYIIDCINWIIHQQLWGYKVEAKLNLGVREQKRLNTTGQIDVLWWYFATRDWVKPRESQVGRCSGRNSNQVPPEHKALLRANHWRQQHYVTEVLVSFSAVTMATRPKLSSYRTVPHRIGRHLDPLTQLCSHGHFRQTSAAIRRHTYELRDTDQTED
jgi:hypothetical protein